jgi:hypothetical protein
MTNLIPWVLIIAFGFLVLLVGVVILVMLRDPSRLMLGQITGSEFVQVQRMLLGDSVRGEHEEAVIVSALRTTAPVLPLETPTRTEDQEETK